MPRYNQLRPLAFRMNREAVADKSEFTAYPFWTLGLPETFKQELLKIIAKAAHRPVDKVHLPVRVLNSAARMLIPNLIAIEQYAGRINTQPWLYGFASPDAGYPASSEAVAFLVRSWIRTALLPDIPPATLRTVTQQITADMLQWKREAMDLTHWTCAGNGYHTDDGTAIPYEKGTSRNGFVLWPDLIAARLSHTTLHWGRHNLTFRRVPTGQGQHGIELVSWPPLEERVDGQIWPYSVLLTLTLQTVPFQSFPVLHCDIGIRRWAGPKVYLPKKVETSVYLLDQVPWIQGLPHDQCFQVAPIKWGYVPANQGTGESGGPRLGWGSDLIPLLDDLHLGKHVFPDPQELADDPYRFMQPAQAHLPAAGLVYRSGLKPSHEIGTGLMPRDRRHFAEQISDILQPEFVFVPPYERQKYSVTIPQNPFFEGKKKQQAHSEEIAVPLAGTVNERLRAVHSTVPSLKLIIRYQSEEVHQALRNAVEELLGYPLALNQGSWLSPQGIVIIVESGLLGSLGEKLDVKESSYLTRYDRQRDAIAQRATEIAARLEQAKGDVGVLIELDNEEVFDGDDPKPALRIGFGRKGYHTQFITPQPDETYLSEKKKGQFETQLKERARAAVRDLLRQFGVIGSRPFISSSIRGRRPQEKKLIIPDSLHYLAIWVIKQSALASPTHIDQDIPVLVHMTSNSWGVEVLAPGWEDWLPYRKAQLALLTQQVSKALRPEQMLQFLLETLDLCLPNFGDTLLFCHAQNLRGIWRWLGNEWITRTLPRELERHERLRIVRLRTGDHEIPEWYAQRGEDEYGFASGIFTVGAGGQVFASVQEKPPTMKDLSKESSKALAQTKLNKKTQVMEIFYPRPDIRAWNPGICEITVSCAQREDALMCAVVTNELRYHFASHFRSPTVYPIPLHLASLLNHYVLPLSKPLRDARTGPDEVE